MSEQKNVIFDYYKILGVNENASQLDIKRAFSKLIIELHPDKVEQTKEIKAKYMLVTEAFDNLKDPYERRAYDMQRKMDNSQGGNIDSLRDSFAKFKKLQESEMCDEDKEIKKLNFSKFIKDSNNKVGYNVADDNALSSDDIKRMLEDRILQRDDEEKEFTPDNLFKDREFNIKEFNKKFIAQSKKREKINKTSKSDAIEKVDNMPDAYGIDDVSIGVDLNDYGKFYHEGIFNDFSGTYAGFDSTKEKDPDEISIDSLDDDDEALKEDKPLAKDDFDALLKQAMNDRDIQDEEIANWNVDQYGSALDDKYGISKQFGFMVGTNASIFGQQRKINNRRYDVKDDDDEVKAYNALTEK